MPASSASSSSGSSRSSRRSLASSASSESRWVLTETYSPAPMLIAPAASPATPAITIADRSLVAPTAPMTMPAVDTIPSLAPRTAARSQLSRLFSPCWCGSSSCGPTGTSASLTVMPESKPSGHAPRNQGKAALATGEAEGPGGDAGERDRERAPREDRGQTPDRRRPPGEDGRHDHGAVAEHVVRRHHLPALSGRHHAAQVAQRAAEGEPEGQSHEDSGSAHQSGVPAVEREHADAECRRGPEVADDGGPLRGQPAAERLAHRGRARHRGDDGPAEDQAVH